MSPWTPKYPDVATSELIDRALVAQGSAAGSDDEDRSYLVDLQSRSDDDTFGAAASLLGSKDPGRRRLGCRVLAELSDRAGQLTYAKRTRDLMSRLVNTESDPKVLRAALV